jgi:hypothetical protein
MEGSPQREIVVEIERIRTVRKRAKTNLKFCRKCARTTDFLAVARAAELFSVTQSGLLEFSQANGCHFVVEKNAEIFLCLADLLTAMTNRARIERSRILGESSNEESSY